MYQVITTNRFERDMRRAFKRGKDPSKLQAIMEILTAGEPLPPKNRDHALIGNYAHRRECHIEPDWLLIYKLDMAEKAIIFERTGTHSDLF